MVAAPFAVGIGARPVALDGDHGGAQVVEGVTEALVGEFVAGAAAVGVGATRPQSRRQARWCDSLVRETSSASARSAGWVPPQGEQIRQRIGSASARPNRASTSMSEATVSTSLTVQ
ncbi:hypothetical protein SALBM311S_08160 [Streptomyces alboniger]